MLYKSKVISIEIKKCLLYRAAAVYMYMHLYNLTFMDLSWTYRSYVRIILGVVGWCEGAVYLTSLGRPTDIGLQLGKACYPCSG